MGSGRISTVDNPFLLLAFAVAQAACTSLDGLTLEQPADTKTCERFTVPPRTGMGDDSAGSIEFVVAVREYDHGDLVPGSPTGRALEMGFDLDMKCTGLGGEGPSCIKTRPPSGQESDGPGGRDNELGAFLASRTALGAPSGTTQGNRDLERGYITMVFRVRGYNGQRDDPQVEVAQFAASVNGEGALTDQNGAIPAPRWDGTDVWQAFDSWVDVDATGRLSTEHPRDVDANAYVTDGRLVAQFDEFHIPSMTLSQAKVTARIRSADNRWFLTEGTTGGRLSLDELLWSSDYTVKDEDPPRFICTDHPGYPAYKEFICALADISDMGPDDGSAECDAVSWAWEFPRTQPVSLSGVFVQQIEYDCPFDTSPKRDNCDAD
jgi:hypothetical protein